MDYRIPMNNTEKSYLFQLAYSTDESTNLPKILEVRLNQVSTSC